MSRRKKSAGAEALESIGKDAGRARLGDRGGSDAHEVLIKLGIVGPSREQSEDEDEEQEL